MKKNLLMGLAAVALLASCSNDEVVDLAPQAAPQAISFDNAFVDNSTRVIANLTGENLTKMLVFGSNNSTSSASGSTQVFGTSSGGVEVTKSVETWTYSPVKYWEATKYYFFSAVSENASSLHSGTLNFAEGQLTISDYTVGDPDLLTAYAAPQAAAAGSNTDPVELAFKHALAKVKFKFISGFNGPVSISDLKLSTIATSGTCVVAAKPDWTPGTPDQSITFNTPISAAITTGTESEEHYVIPQSIGSIKVSFTATVTVDNVERKKEHTITLTAPSKLDVANAYTFEATIGPDQMALEPIKFNVSVGTWTTPGSTDITPSNP